MARKSIHFTSDWHIGHANSITFDQRPFNDLDHMHRVLVNNYNAQVPKDGVCYFLGDIGLSSSEKAKEIIAQLNGFKVCIMGNHDKGSQALYDIGFDLVLNGGIIYVAGERVTMTHCPLRGVFREDVTDMRNVVEGEMWHGESRHKPYSVEDEGQFHLHGHIHSGPANTKLPIDGRQMDVGVPANKYRPVHISAIESWIAQTKMKGG
jgi:calcineurin-like phosphoesterase family protein